MKKNNMIRRKTLAIDFDGVIHKYSKGWADGTIYDGPMDGAMDSLDELMMTYNVFILSTRSTDQIVEWFHVHFPYIPCRNINGGGPFWNTAGIIGVTNEKYAAEIYIDDRALRFWDWDSALGEIAKLT
jgi:5'(3')-deoxyribonucleotidase